MHESCLATQSVETGVPKEDSGNERQLRAAESQPLTKVRLLWTVDDLPQVLVNIDVLNPSR
jgi:hypothetical protein